MDPSRNHPMTMILDLQHFTLRGFVEVFGGEGRIKQRENVMSSQGQAKLKRAWLARLTRAAGAETDKAVLARQVQRRVINYEVAVMDARIGMSLRSIVH